MYKWYQITQNVYLEKGFASWAYIAILQITSSNRSFIYNRKTVRPRMKSRKDH